MSFIWKPSRYIPDDHAPPDRELFDGHAERMCLGCLRWFTLPPPTEIRVYPVRLWCPYCDFDFSSGWLEQWPELAE